MRKNFKAANEGAAKIKKYAPTKETEFRKLFRNRFKDKNSKSPKLVGESSSIKRLLSAHTLCAWAVRTFEQVVYMVSEWVEPCTGQVKLLKKSSLIFPSNRDGSAPNRFMGDHAVPPAGLREKTGLCVRSAELTGPRDKNDK
ncbi:hypothetical protein RRG08_024317 [Elysia crispata]|uniref:Uncharacterized protein n=1 Tax=Elysia crispata TaxID=231223 RepID=A0AAE1DRU9_9GAST|nr:hypothetical protein RRG08_024317 [Elysia crispata]